MKMDKAGKNHSQISKHLNDKGMSTLNGEVKWFPGTVRNILRKGKGEYLKSLDQFFSKKREE